jgi:signal transduction histidine kinase
MAFATSPLRRSRSAVVVVGLGLFVLLVYLVVVLAGDALLRHTGSPQVGLSLLATAVVALAFEPVRDRLERLAAHRGGRGTPYDVLRGLSETVTGGVPSGELPGRMAMLLARATGAEWAQVWLVGQNRASLAATWPPSTTGDTRPPDLTDESPQSEHRTRRVRHAGELLALLRVQQPDGGPLTPLEERLFSGLAAQAGLVLHSARLRAELAARRDELAARAVELSASRQRLIETQDAERAQLERDIHDGAQQHLVALAVNLRLADVVAARSPERATLVLEKQADAAREAIDTLLRLSRGIYPRLLTERGLVAALRAAMAISPIPVTVHADATPRLPPAAEAALYFCCVEAVQNATKHSRADSVTVTVTTDESAVRVTVTDTGRGFDVTTAEPGAGLQNMHDRVDAVGGRLTVFSLPAQGTRVEVQVPVSADERSAS